MTVLTQHPDVRKFLLLPLYLRMLILAGVLAVVFVAGCFIAVFASDIPTGGNTLPPASSLNP